MSPGHHNSRVAHRSPSLFKTPHRQSVVDALAPSSPIPGMPVKSKPGARATYMNGGMSAATSPKVAIIDTPTISTHDSRKLVTNSLSSINSLSLPIGASVRFDLVVRPLRDLVHERLAVQQPFRLVDDAVHARIADDPVAPDHPQGFVKKRREHHEPPPTTRPPPLSLAGPVDRQANRGMRRTPGS